MPIADCQLLTTTQTPSKLVTSSKFLQSPSSRLTPVFMRWPATAVAAAVVAGEVAVAVEEAAAAVVVVSFVSPYDNEQTLIGTLGWTGGNGDPVRNSRW